MSCLGPLLQEVIDRKDVQLRLQETRLAELHAELRAQTARAEAERAELEA